MPVSPQAAAVLLREIQEEIDTHTDIVLDGKVKDFAEYKYEVGYIRALTTILELYRKAEVEVNS